MLPFLRVSASSRINAAAGCSLLVDSPYIRRPLHNSRLSNQMSLQDLSPTSFMIFSKYGAAHDNESPPTPEIWI